MGPLDWCARGLTAVNMKRGQMMDTMAERARRASLLTWFSVALNVVLALGKLIFGVFGHSAALVADALHSFSDFVTDFAVLIGMRLAGQPGDENHPYGHGKFETLSALLVGVFLCAVGLMIGFYALVTIVESLRTGLYPLRPSPSVLWAALASIIVKEVLYQVTVREAVRSKNDALLANAWHHRSDALSSVGTAVGAGAAALLGGRWILLDQVSAIVVGGILLRIAWQIVRESMDKLMERGMSHEERERIYTIAHRIPMISEPHNLRSRRVGAVAVIEMHIRVDPKMTVLRSHGLACRLEQLLLREFGRESIITIHVEPARTSELRSAPKDTHTA